MASQAAPEDAVPVHGSKFQDRGLVPQPGLRKQLLEFCSAAGMSGDDYDSMKAAFTALSPTSAARVVLPLLGRFSRMGDDRRRVRQQQWAFFADIASPAPASQVLPECVWLVAERLLAADGSSTAADQRQLARSAPGLNALLQPHLDRAQLPPSIAAVLASLLQVV